MMEALKQFVQHKKFTWLLIGLGTLVILGFYFSKVSDLYIVWELVDEYGYLANAAYLSNTKWAWITTLYYGYGYSLWLVPLFWVCNTGVQMIRATVLFNAICVVLLFWIQYTLMSKLCKNTNRNIIVAISFILCMYPYIVSSSLKVICEVLLTLLVWVCGLLLYQAVETGRWYYYALLALSMVYLFFVHTRAFVFCGVIVIIFGLAFLLKKISWKQLLLFAVLALGFLVLGFALKNQIIDGVYSNELFPHIAEVGNAVGSAGEEISNVTVGNTLSVEYVFKRILGVFTNFSIWHMYTFASRNLYLLVSTLGMFHVGIIVIFKDVLKEIKSEHKIGSINLVKLLYAVGAVMMVVATVVQSPGNRDMPAYNFYGRYYEYLIGPAVFIGVVYCIQHRIKLAGIVALFATIGVASWFTYDINNHLNTYELYYDSTRLAAFAMFSDKAYVFSDVVRVVIGFIIVATVIILVLNNIQKLRWLIPVVLMTTFLLNDFVIIRNTLSLHAENKDDYQVATYVHSYCPDVDEIYFLSNGYIMTTAYAGIQVLLGQEKLTLIEENNADILKSGDIFVTFGNNPYVDLIEEDVTKLAETRYYDIFVVE